MKINKQKKFKNKIEERLLIGLNQIDKNQKSIINTLLICLLL